MSFSQHAIHMIRAAFFGLDDTLHDRDTTIRKPASEQYDEIIGFSSDISRDVFVASFIQLGSKGYVSKKAVYPQLCQERGIPLNPEFLFEDFWQRYHGRVAPFPFLREMPGAL